MPQYTFECPTCNVKFTRTLKMANHTSHECPSCKEAAPRVLDGEGFAFQFQQGGGATANSGVHDHDYPSADKAVGRSAAERWAMMRARDEVKAQARALGETHALIRHTVDASTIAYEPMTSTGLDARRKLARHAVEVARSSRPPKSG